MFKNRNRTIIFFSVIILSTIFHFVHFYQMKAHNPLFDIPIVDAGEYVNVADYYVNVRWLGAPASYYHPPLYSYFLALIFKILGRSLDIIKFLQIIINLINILLVFLIAKKVFDEKIGLISMVFYAFYIPVIHYSMEILPPILIIFLLLMSTMSLLSLWESQKLKKLKFRWLLLSGVCFGFLVVTLPNFLLCLPFILGWQFACFKNISLHKKIKYVVLFAAISLLPAFLVTVRNYLVARELVFISYNGGVNFYIGNNANISKTLSIRPGIEWEELVMRPYWQERITNYAEQSQFWYRQGLQFVFNQPLAWIALLVKKAILFFNAYEFPRNFDLDFFTQYSVITKLPIFRLNIILPLGLSALLLLCFRIDLREKREGINLLYLLILSYAFSIILVFVMARYRLPIVPFLTIFAAYYCFAVFEKLRNKDYLTMIKFLGVGLVFIVFTQIRFFNKTYPYKVNLADTYIELGNSLLHAQKYEQSYYYFKKGLEEPIDQSTYQSYFYFAYYYFAVGDTQKTIEFFKKSVEFNPQNFRALVNLGFIYKMNNKIDTAMYYLNKARLIAPCFPDLYFNLADCYLLKYEWNKAIEVLGSFNNVCPSPDPTVHFHTGKLYMELFQNWEKAIEHFELAIKYPQDQEIRPETFDRLGNCYYNIEQYDKAERVWKRGLKMYPHYRPLKENLQIIQGQ